MNAEGSLFRLVDFVQGNKSTVIRSSPRHLVCSVTKRLCGRDKRGSKAGRSFRSGLEWLTCVKQSIPRCLIQRWFHIAFGQLISTCRGAIINSRAVLSGEEGAHVASPDANRGEISDMLFIYGAKSLTRIQIFALEAFDQAFELRRGPGFAINVASRGMRQRWFQNGELLFKSLIVSSF